jgi:hypothetical protein
LLVVFKFFKNIYYYFYEENFPHEVKKKLLF